jgi:hypothetical protein
LVTHNMRTKVRVPSYRSCWDCTWNCPVGSTDRSVFPSLHCFRFRESFHRTPMEIGHWAMLSRLGRIQLLPHLNPSHQHHHLQRHHHHHPD